MISNKELHLFFLMQKAPLYRNGYRMDQFNRLDLLSCEQCSLSHTAFPCAWAPSLILREQLNATQNYSPSRDQVFALIPI